MATRGAVWVPPLPHTRVAGDLQGPSPLHADHADHVARVAVASAGSRSAVSAGLCGRPLANLHGARRIPIWQLALQVWVPPLPHARVASGVHMPSPLHADQADHDPCRDRSCAFGCRIGHSFEMPRRHKLGFRRHPIGTCRRTLAFHPFRKNARRSAGRPLRWRTLTMPTRCPSPSHRFSFGCRSCHTPARRCQGQTCSVHSPHWQLATAGLRAAGGTGLNRSGVQVPSPSQGPHSVGLPVAPSHPRRWVPQLPQACSLGPSQVWLPQVLHWQLSAHVRVPAIPQDSAAPGEQDPSPVQAPQPDQVPFWQTRVCLPQFPQT